MVNEPQEESLLGDVPAVSDAQWDSMLSSTFSAPPGFADYLVDMFDSVTEDGTTPDAAAGETDTADDGSIDPDAIDDLDADDTQPQADASDDAEADDQSNTDDQAAGEHVDDTLVDDDPTDSLTGAGESTDTDYDAYDTTADYSHDDALGGDDIDLGDLGL
jgi:hypothetical protein